jgi:hypothetical protein
MSVPYANSITGKRKTWRRERARAMQQNCNSENSWNKTRIFAAHFSANVFARQTVRKKTIFFELFFDPASVETFITEARVRPI